MKYQVSCRNVSETRMNPTGTGALDPLLTFWVGPMNGRNARNGSSVDGVDCAAGNVYVLEVKGFDLPVCKIGMTKKDPEIRCAEINNSSTGDFIWAVKYFVTVNDCARFESLVHRELEIHRQRRREIFELPADDAYDSIRTMLAQQSEIKELLIAFPLPAVKVKSRRDGTSSGGHVVKKGDELYARILQSFLSRLQVKGGRPFGQWRNPRFGLSDDAAGVQWNIGIHREDKEIWLGVNLEGMAYDGSWRSRRSSCRRSRGPRWTRSR
jgi:hypothetical protein